MYAYALRRLAGCGLVAALVVGCAPAAGDEAARYLGSAGERRALLVASLTNPANGYSRLRLARYASGARGDWDALPEWNPPVASVGDDGSVHDDEAALDLGIGDGALALLGRAAFFRYPAELLARDGARARARVAVRLPDGRRQLALTCASCHAGDVDGVRVPGRADETIDVGWGPGRVDVAGGEEPIAIPDLRAVAWQTHLHRDGTVRNGPGALAVRIETLIITAHNGVVRPPRRVALALARYLWELASTLPPPSTPPPGSAAARGAARFATLCAGCHAGPGLAGAPVALDVIGTDARVGRSAERGTGGYRVPSLRGVATRSRLLHDGSVASLAALFDPARLDADYPGGRIAGHDFGLSLPPAERAALLAYLATL